MVLRHLRSLTPTIVAVGLLFAVGCSSFFPGRPAETLPPGPAPIVGAGDAATFEDGTARISEVEVWRDREPVVRERPPCADLCARVRIATSGFEPHALRVTELWVVRGSAAGRFGVVEAEPDLPDLPGLVVTGERGPRADRDDEVVVVARVVRSDGAQRLVRSDRVAVDVRG